MKQIFRTLFSRKALKPAGLLLILSAIYELAYYSLFALVTEGLLRMGLFFLLVLAAFAVLYVLFAPESAGKARFETGRILRMLIFPAGMLVLFYGLLTPLYGAALASPWLLTVFEIFCAVLLIGSGPLALVWIRSAADGKKPWQDLKRGITDRMLLNGWCFLLLARILIDTLTGGIFTLSYGVNAYSLLSLTLFQFDPLSSAALYGSAGMSGPALLFCLVGCLYAWMIAGWFHGTD